MRPASWVWLFVVATLGSACGDQANAKDRQMRELESRVRQLQASSDRMESRVLALEALMRTPRPVSTQSDQRAPMRPELPVVRVNPGQPATESHILREGTSEDPSDDAARLSIVGQGSRVETRSVTGGSQAALARPAKPSNSRAPKTNQSTLSTASSGGAPQ